MTRPSKESMDRMDGKKTEFVHFDDIFERYGHVGRYQWLLFLLFGVRSAVMVTQLFTAVFIVASVPHRCQIPGLANDSFPPSSLEHARLINSSIPCHKKTGNDAAEGCTWSSCEVYADGNRNSTQTCSAWIFDHSTFDSTITEQFSLVCDRKYMISHLKMVMMLGILFGSVISGQVSDLLGRKVSEVIGYILLYVCGTFQVLSPNIWVLLVFRFFVGLGISGFQVPAYIHCMEMIGARWRTIFGNLFGLFWTSGGLLLAMSAYFVRDWKHLQLIATLPWVPFFILHVVFIPESPRWLIAKKKLTRAERALAGYASWNRKPEMTREDIENIAANIKNQPRTLTFLFKSKILTIRALIVWFTWIAYALAYYGITWVSGNFSGNIYLNFAINMGVPFPCYLLAPVLLKTIGRKALTCSCFFIGGLCCISTTFIYLYGDPKNDKGWFWGMMTLVLIGKFAAAMNFQSGYLYTSELFSTSTRSATQGVASMFARVGGMIAPYIADLPEYVTTALDQSLSQIVFGGVNIIAGFLCLYLPETRDMTQLPDTIEAAENIARKPSGTRSVAKKVDFGISRQEEDTLL